MLDDGCRGADHLVGCRQTNPHARCVVLVIQREVAAISIRCWACATQALALYSAGSIDTGAAELQGIS